MGFAEPLYLVLLALFVPVGGLLLVHRERRRRADLAVFGEPALLERSSLLPASHRRLAGQGLALLGLALVLLALARPQLGEKPLVLSRTGRDVVFVLDLSRSMNAEDVAPSRLSAAKQAVREILESSPGDRVGLVVFGGSAFLQVPLTLDRAAFELFLGGAETDDISDPSTNLAAALATASTAFGYDSEPRYRVVVLLSDGEAVQGDAGRALEKLEREGVRVFAVGVGTSEGAPIPSRAGGRLLGYHRDARGELAITRLEEEVLRRIAEETDGSYVRLSGRGAGLQRLADELARLEKREISSRTFTRLVDRYQWPLAAALAALIAESLLAPRGRGAAGARGRPHAPPVARKSEAHVATRAARKRGSRQRSPRLLVLLALAAGMVNAGAAAAPAQERSEAERLYRSGRYREAYEAFRRMADEKRDNAALEYNAGNALYRLGSYEPAAASFRDAFSGEPSLRQRSYYNLGNALFKASETLSDRRAALRKAISAYEESLLLDPTDAAAKWNLELALRELTKEEERRAGGGGRGADGRGGRNEGPPQPGGGGEDSRGGVGGAGAEPDSAAPAAPSEPRPEAGERTSGQALTEAQARQLLQAIQNEESEALESQDEGRAYSSSGAKDW